jgi:hypothetical protein
MISHSERPIGAAADFDDIVAAIERAPQLAPHLAALALAEVRYGIITGEGPTTRGRIHFSRTIDATDAAMCEMILVAAAGPHDEPVTREEAEILFDIHDAALDREDGGHFDDLLVKAVAHQVLAAAGRAVPPRATALARTTPLGQWAAAEEIEAISREVAAWLERRIRASRRAGGPLRTIAAMLLAAGMGAAPVTTALASLIGVA